MRPEEASGKPRGELDDPRNPTQSGVLVKSVALVVSERDSPRPHAPYGRGLEAPPPAALVARPTRILLHSQPDSRLVKLAQEGSVAAFEEIVRRYQAPLEAFARTIVGSWAEDAVQQALLNACRALREGGAREVELRPWLYRITRNAAIDIVRSGGHDWAELDLQYDGVPQPPRLAEQREQLRALVSQLQSLPERQRRALVAYTMEGISHDEIAAELGVSRAAARQLIFRAREALRGVAAVLVPMPLLRTLGKTSAAGTEAAAATKGGMLSVAALKGTAAVAAAGATASLVVVGVPAAIHVAHPQRPARQPVSVSRYRHHWRELAAPSQDQHPSSRPAVTPRRVTVLLRCAVLAAPTAPSSSTAGGHPGREAAPALARRRAAECRKAPRQHVASREHALAVRRRGARSQLASRRRVIVRRRRALLATSRPASLRLRARGLNKRAAPVFRRRSLAASGPRWSRGRAR